MLEACHDHDIPHGHLNGRKTMFNKHHIANARHAQSTPTEARHTNRSLSHNHKAHRTTKTKSHSQTHNRPNSQTQETTATRSDSETTRGPTSSLGAGAAEAFERLFHGGGGGGGRRCLRRDLFNGTLFSKKPAGKNTHQPALSDFPYPVSIR